MSLSEIKEKTNWTHVVIGVSSSLLTLAIVAVVAVCFCGFRYRNIVLLNSEQVVKEEVQSTVTIPEAELLTQLHQKGILMTPAEYTGHLATYYDTLVAFLAVFFVIFSIFGYLGVRSMSRKEVAQVAKDVVADSYELRTGIKSMIMGEIDENMVHAEDYDATIAEINERLDKCVYAEDPLPEQKMTIADPKEAKKMGAKGRRIAIPHPEYKEPELIASIADVQRVIRQKHMYDANGNPDLEQVAQEYNIKVRREELPSLQSGYLRHSKDEGWVIGVNKKHPSARQRFTIAHELGHYVLHRNDRGTTDFEDEIFFRATDVSPMEYAANMFAADLLMPEDRIREEISNGTRDLSELANKFSVSIEAMKYKVESLGYIIK